MLKRRGKLFLRSSVLCEIILLISVSFAISFILNYSSVMAGEIFKKELFSTI